MSADLSKDTGAIHAEKTRLWMKKYNGDESVYLEPMSVGLNVTDLSNPLDCKGISETERTNFQFLYDNLVKLTFS